MEKVMSRAELKFFQLEQARLELITNNYYCFHYFASLFLRIGDMGELSAVNAIKSVMKGTPSFCIRGIKISEHLGQQLKKLGIDYVKEEAEMDIINVSCDGDKINVIFGECKVLYTF